MTKGNTIICKGTFYQEKGCEFPEAQNIGCGTTVVMIIGIMVGSTLLFSLFSIVLWGLLKLFSLV